MAEAPKSLEYLLSCPICFEEFAENDDHVPRLLLCTHTLCEQCIKQLIRNNKLECPEFKTKHNVTNNENKEKSFAQNKYILTSVRRKAAPAQEVKLIETCKEHGKELDLFCKEEGCQVAICSRCHLRKHKKHEVVEIEEQKKEELNRNIETIKTNLEAKIRKIVAVKEEIEKKTGTAVGKLINKKQKIVEKFDKIIKDIEDESRGVYTTIDEDVSTMRENLIPLQSLEESVHGDDDETYEEIMNKLETADGIEDIVREYFSGYKTYTYHKYTESQPSEETLCGNVTKEEINVSLSDSDGTDVQRKITYASQLKCQVRQVINCRPLYLFRMTSVDNNKVIVYGKENQTWKLRYYNLNNGEEMANQELGCEPTGLAVIEIGGKSTIAVSDYFEQRIEFRDLTDIKTVIYTHNVTPNEPGQMCVWSRFILLCEGMFNIPRKVHLLDCSGTHPKPLNGKNVIRTELLVAILVATDVWSSKGGIYAYNTATDELMWSVKGRLEGMEKDIKAYGVAFDGRGCISVSDWNNGCIHMFSVRDRRYMGVVIKDGEQGLGEPGEIQWCETTSSLVVMDKKKNKWLITVINVK